MKTQKTKNISLIIGLSVVAVMLGFGIVRAALTFDNTSVVSDGAITVRGAAGSDIVVGNAAQTGTIYIGSSTGAFTLNIANSNVSNTINIGGGTATNTINLGTGGTAVDVIRIGDSVADLALTDADWSITTAGFLTAANTSSTNVSSTRLDVKTSAGSSTLAVSSNLVRVAAHVSATGTLPTVGTCGTSPTIVGTDNASFVTVGTNAATTGACTITFASAFKSPPVCVITAHNTSTNIIFQASSTASTVAINSFGTGAATTTMAQVKLSVLCLGID